MGIEDDGTVTGHGYAEEPMRAILDTPRARLRPPQAPGFIVRQDADELLVFDVPASDTPVQVDGNGFPLRMGDRTVQASESQIQALKFVGLAESWEARPSQLRVTDLDPALLARARQSSGLQSLSDEEYLLKRKLADRRGASIALRRAAELVFATDGPLHPNAGLRIFRVIGTERKVGSAHNVEERPRIEGNLPAVLTEAFATIERYIRRPSRLRGDRFKDVPEYPEYSWKEAILNAVGHRDYSIEGRTTEIWLFEDRLEVASPGGLVPDLTLDELLRLERIHMSRNPRVVRTLVDLGFMRDQGEGIPRMFAEMEGQFLPAPQIEVKAREFVVTLRNTPVLTESDRSFVSSLGPEVSDLEFRALLEVYRRGMIDNARLRDITGLDTLGASALLRRLRDRGLLKMRAAGSASYYELAAAANSPPGEPQRLSSSHLPASDRGGFETSKLADRGGLPADRGGFEPQIQQVLSDLGPRPRKAKLRRAILQLTALRPWRPVELADALAFNPAKLVERHLKEMVAEGLLERTHPENPAHPAQAYRAVQLPMDVGDQADSRKDSDSSDS